MQSVWCVQIVSWWPFHLSQGCPLAGEGWVSLRLIPSRNGLNFVSLSRCAYVMLCESDENRILAEFVLNTIMKFFLEHVTSHEQGNAEVSESDTQVIKINDSHWHITTNECMPLWYYVTCEKNKVTFLLIIPGTKLSTCTILMGYLL